MNKCPQCKVILYNRTDTCPLCHCVVEELEPAEEKRAKDKFGEGAPYPNAQRRHKWLRFALHLVLFVFVIVEALLILINHLTTPGFCWAAITGVALAYGYLFLLVWIRNDSGFALKVGLQILFTMVVLYEIDKFTGNYGWALQWAIPGTILLGDGIVFILMMLNRSHWFSYSLLLILMGVCSLGILGLYFIKVISNLVLPVICVAVTGIYLLATITFGEKAMKRELGRRFHI
ncbi:MAG: hypothetical protein K6B69_03000 [Lachnospiraceae bacterium]|nr:hypothetical protein [Lachnospiraceae bacterium]